MSIASEITRLRGAKEDIRSAVEKRGILAADSQKLSDYPPLIESVPYAVKGTVTPEEDADIFEIKGLGFVPQSISVVCGDYEKNPVENALGYFHLCRGRMGIFMFIDKTLSKKFVNLSSGSSVYSWSDDGVTFYAPNPESYGYFKKGYTYDFIITGGFDE